MTERFEQYVAAALIETALQYPDGINSPIRVVYNLPSNILKVKFDAAVIDEALRILRECGIAYISDDPLAGRFVKINREKYESFFSNVDRESREYDRIVRDARNENEGLNNAENQSWRYLKIVGKYKVLTRYREFGSEWIRLAMETLAMPDGESRAREPDLRSVSIEADPSIVSQINQGLDEIEEQINLNNEIGNAIGDKREVALLEIGALRKLISGTKIRKQFVLDFAKKSLSWIGETVGKTTFTELIKHVSKLLIDWLA
jgi:hypothetical protein